LIDYTLVILLLPGVLFGTNTGVLLNQILPDFALNTIFFVFLCVVCPYLFFKGKDLRKYEKEAKEI